MMLDNMDERQAVRDSDAYREAATYVSPIKAVRAVSGAKLNGYSCVYDGNRGIVLETRYDAVSGYTFEGTSDTDNW
jgi:hypothetical protein